MLTGKKVLIAEDEAAMRFFVVGILKQQLNCEEVVQCDNGNDALNELTSSSKNSIDLILCDWEMPGAKGDEILAAVRGDKDIQHIPFIMTTSRSDKDSLVKVAELGIDDYLVKPFSAADLIKRIKRVLRPVTKKRHENKMKGEQMATAKLTFRNNNSYEGEIKSITQTDCEIKTHLFKHGINGLYDKADLAIQYKNNVVYVKAEISGIALPADEDFSSKKHMLVSFALTIINEPNRRKLIQMIADLK